jgi:hypothetical protein
MVKPPRAFLLPIGEHFGRDHSTVIHAHNLIQRRVTSDSAFCISIEKIERELKAMVPMRPLTSACPPVLSAASSSQLRSAPIE